MIENLLEMRNGNLPKQPNQLFLIFINNWSSVASLAEYNENGTVGESCPGVLV